jgi:hypothetical protein
MQKIYRLQQPEIRPTKVIAKYNIKPKSDTKTDSLANIPQEHKTSKGGGG